MKQQRAKPLLGRIAFIMILCGLTLIFARGTIADLAYGLTKTNGVYIPQATYIVPRGSSGEVTHIFRIYNLQRKPLQLQAEPDCGCTGVSWQKTTIAPFRWKDITAKMEVKPQKSQSVTITFQTDRIEKPYLFAFLRLME